MILTKRFHLQYIEVSRSICTLGEDFDKVQQNIQERVHHGLQDDIN